MAAYTSTQAGDWSLSATWGGGGVPGVADTATVSHEVDITTTVTVGGLTLNNTLNISGSLTLAGAAGFATSGWILNVEAGGTLDLGAQTLTPTAPGKYNFVGTSVSRATVTSTGSIGFFNAPGVNPVTLDWQYCDFDNIHGYPGRTQTTAIVQNVTYCTFTNCGDLQIDVTGTSAGAGFIFEYNKVTDWRAANPTGSGERIPNIYQTARTTTAPRRCRFNVFDNSMNASPGAVQIRSSDVDISENVFHEVSLDSIDYASSANLFVTKNFFSLSLDQNVFNSTSPIIQGVIGNYFYFSQGGHISWGLITHNRWIGNIFDLTNGSVGANVDLGGAGLTIDCVFSNNIHLGTGNIMAFTGNPVGGTFRFSQNTTHLDNAGQDSGGIDLSPWLITEQVASNVTPAAIELWDNVHFDTNDANTVDTMVDLMTSTADQIDLIDYNCGWGSPSGSPSPALSYGANVSITGGVGNNDFAADPQFVDRTRNLAVWDAALGGPGTEANAITELLKRNDSDWDSNYDPVALFNYVFAGFAPQNASLTAGRYSGSVGAASLKKDVAVPLVTWASGLVVLYPPAISAYPAITGIFETGEVLSVSTGTWTNSPTSYTYQWTRNGSDIAGATNNTYTIVSADEGNEIDCDVTAINDDGSAEVNATGEGTVVATNNILLETGDNTLLETGDNMLTEAALFALVTAGGLAVTHLGVAVSTLLT